MFDGKTFTLNFGTDDPHEVAGIALAAAYLAATSAEMLLRTKLPNSKGRRP